MERLNEVLKDKERISLWNDDCVPLYDETIEEQHRPNVISYVVENSKSCVIICPGGGYAHKAYHEGEPIALWLNSIGVSAFVLDYRVSPYRFPCPQLDAKRAIRYARHNAKKYGYDADKIGILGFSAGGHLAASCGTMLDDLGYQKQDDIDEESARPDFMILCYPVISFVEYGHVGSALQLLGDSATEEEKSRCSIENCVTEETCPAFIWHTSSDMTVLVENSLRFATELSRNKIPFEIHTFFEGAHGLGLAQDYENIGLWTKLCEKWMKKSNYLEGK